MLVELFPRANVRHASLPVLGQYLEGFLAWLRARGYPDLLLRRRVRAAHRFELLLRQRHVVDVSGLTADDLLAYIPAHAEKDVSLAAAIRSFVDYFEHHRMLACVPATPGQKLIEDYSADLQNRRGLADSTVQQHAITVREFLEFVVYDRDPDCLQTLSREHLEAFLRRISARRSRASLQHVAAHLRGFLRWLADRGPISHDLAGQIDTPRVYRGEKLPRALAWETVLDFLNAIDRSTVIGRRDYAMFLLIVTYGLRTSEVVALTLDDFQWRERRIRVPRSKVGRPLLLPLTVEVGAAVIDYLQRGRPILPHREVFLRVRSPDGVLKPTAVTEAFQAWTRRGGLPISFHGPHCLRHSLAMHLLRRGISLKTIGDLLGHSSAESTCVYLRLQVDDLRDVALDLPQVDGKESHHGPH